MTAQQDRIVFEESRRLPTPYHLGDDPRPLQVTFGSLFDDAANAVFLAGLDLDAVLVDRFLIVRARSEDYEIPALFLADPERLAKSAMENVTRPDDWAAATIESVKIVVKHDELAALSDT